MADGRACGKELSAGLVCADALFAPLPQCT
jgi:hypothetical protein